LFRSASALARRLRFVERGELIGCPHADREPDCALVFALSRDGIANGARILAQRLNRRALRPARRAVCVAIVAAAALGVQRLSRPHVAEGEMPCDLGRTIATASSAKTVDSPWTS